MLKQALFCHLAVVDIDCQSEPFHDLPLKGVTHWNATHVEPAVFAGAAEEAKFALERIAAANAGHPALVGGLAIIRMNIFRPAEAERLAGGSAGVVVEEFSGKVAGAIL